MVRKQTWKKLIYVLCALLLLAVTFIGGRGVIPAFAEISTNSNALSDLLIDTEFKVSDYPENPKDNSIQVIQIAESVTGGLYVYTYQPCQNSLYLTATQVNMSLTDKMSGVVDETELAEEDKPKLYELSLVNSSGVFCKYRVTDFTVSLNPVRYYNIVSIYRKFITGVDTPTGDDNTINSVYFTVSKLYTAKTVNGSVTYACKNVDVVEILNPYVDFVSYYDGLTWGSIFGLEPEGYTDVHYIAFSPDRQIDTLKEADITYTTQEYNTAAFKGGTTYGEESLPQYKTLTGDMTAGKYSWQCIQRSADFIEVAKLNGATAATVAETEFVLVFLTTPYAQKPVYSFMQGHSYEVSGTKVSNVSILRLMFETDGITYNLGALMNQQEGDDIPGNARDPLNSDYIGFFAYVWRCIVRLFSGTATLNEQIVAVIALFICLFTLPIVAIVLSIVFPAFGAVMKIILKGLWWLICLPFKIIAAIVRKCRGD